MGEIKKYSIGDQEYFQKDLVFGQTNQLIGLVKGIAVTSTLTTMDIVALLGDKLPVALAVILQKEGQDLKTRNLEEFAEEIAFNFTPAQIIEVIQDFFTSSQIPSILNLANAALEKINEAFQEAQKGIGSLTSSVSSLKET